MVYKYLAILLLIASYVVRAQSLPADYNCKNDGKNDFQEDRFGPGNLHTVSANGALAAGFSKRGELTVLRWPSPSYYDHVLYLTPMFFKDACKVRKKELHGAKKTHGVFAGIRTGNDIEFFRDQVYKNTQRYLDHDSSIVVNEMVHKNSGMKIVQKSYVDSDSDTLILNFDFINSQQDVIDFVFYENLSPSNGKFSFLPYRDTLFEFINDYALVYSKQHEALVHFRPYRKLSKRKLKRELKDGVDNFLDISSDQFFPYHQRNIFISLGLSKEVSNFQVGKVHRFLGKELGNQHSYYNIQSGPLLRNEYNLGRSNGALEAKLKTDENGNASITVYISFGHTASSSLKNLKSAKKNGHKTLFKRTHKWWVDWISKAQLPKTNDQKILNVSKRALINIRNGYDKNTGGIIASLANQPTYFLVWPRDIAFIAYALDKAGYKDMATHSIEFVNQQQRNCDADKDWSCKVNWLFKKISKWDLDGTFAMNYFADGQEGGPIFFEIDNTALMVWITWEHYLSLGKKTIKGKEFLKRNYPVIKKASESLINCFNEKKKLPCKAFEDDNIALQQNLQGAASVYAAYKAAFAAAKEVGDDHQYQQKLKLRIQQLKQGIYRNFQIRPHVYEGQWGASAWLVWPANYFKDTGLDICPQLEYLQEILNIDLGKQNQGSRYDGKFAMSLAIQDPLQLKKCGFDFQKLNWNIDVLIKEMPDQETLQFGEAFVSSDFDGDGKKEFSNRTAIPHIWAGSLNFLAALFHFEMIENF